MNNISLRIQIFFLVALAVLAVAFTSFRATSEFLVQDKVASLRELQTLSLMSTLQDLREQSQSLRQEMRTLAVQLFQKPEQIGIPRYKIASLSGSHVWSEIALSPADAKNTTLPSPHSLVFDSAEILKAPTQAPTSAAPSTTDATWSYSFAEEDGQEMLTIQETLLLGEGQQYVLKAKISAEVLNEIISKLQFRSIDVRLYKNDQNGLRAFHSSSSGNEADRQELELQVRSSTSKIIEGRSFAYLSGEDETFISFSNLRLSNGESNLVVAFVSEKSTLMSEFRHFIAEQLFTLLSILGAALLAGFFVTRLIAQPVAELVEATQALEQGRFDYRVKSAGSNEIGRLASAFNHLGRTLEDREEALASAENSMRRLSFQTELFKRLAELTDRITKIKETKELQSTIVNAWPTLLEISLEKNCLAFYRFDSDSGSYRLEQRSGRTINFSKIIGSSLWPKETPFTQGDEVIEAETQRSLCPNEAQMYRLPIVSDGKNFGVLVFSAHEVETAEYFETLIHECHRLFSTSFESADRYATLREVSIRDGLTGLFNVRFFKETLEQEVTKASVVKNELALLFFDVDHFKKYNDTNGHPAGDRVLKAVGSLMRQCFDSKDIVARYGGEEFVVLLKNTDHASALVQAERFREVIEKYKFENEETQPLGFLSVSIGVANLHDHGNFGAELIKAAGVFQERCRLV